MTTFSGSSSSRRRPQMAAGARAVRAVPCELRKSARGDSSRVKAARCVSVKASASSLKVLACRRPLDHREARNSRRQIRGGSVNAWLISTPRSPATRVALPRTPTSSRSFCAARTSSRAATWGAAAVAAVAPARASAMAAIVTAIVIVAAATAAAAVNDHDGSVILLL